jgi:hypothetical protein
LLMKMASEMARRYEEERAKGNIGPVHEHNDESSPPPAYAR